MSPGATIDELVVVGEPAPWRALGFSVSEGTLVAGSVRVRLRPPDTDSRRGLIGWSLRDAPSHELDGLPTVRSEAAPPPAVKHPNGTTGIDHVVVLTPELTRTIRTFEQAGIECRRVRDGQAGERPVRQAFFRLGEVIVEAVEAAGAEEGGGEPERHDRPAAFWGLVFVVGDMDACKTLLGDLLGDVRDAVQPGRRIVTVSRRAGLQLPVALITADQR